MRLSVARGESMSEIRYALRGLSRNLGFASVAVLTLALGTGANTVIFTIFHSVLIRPLDFREPERLYTVQETVPPIATIAPVLPVNALHFGEWRKNNSVFDGLGMVGGANFNLTSDGEPVRVPGLRISASVLPI